MPTIDLIATLAIVAVFGAFMLSLAYADRKTNTTWPQMKPAGKVTVGPHGGVKAA